MSEPDVIHTNKEIVIHHKDEDENGIFSDLMHLWGQSLQILYFVEITGDTQ